MKLCFCYPRNERKKGLYIVARNKGRACRLYAHRTGETWEDIKAEKRTDIDISDILREVVIYPNSDLDYVLGLDYETITS